MKFTLPESARVNCLASVSRLQNVLNHITGDQISSVQHLDVILKSYTCFASFRAAIIKYGMAVKTKSSKGRGSEVILEKTHTLPTFEFTPNKPPKSPGRNGKAKAQIADDSKMVKPKRQGDGSVLKPMFNHSIEPCKDRYQLDSFENYGPSKIDIMRKIEDIGGYQGFMHSKPDNRHVHRNKGRY